MERTWLKEIRKEKKMSMANVAENAGIGQGYYCDIENGKRGYEVPVRTAKAIASTLGFPWEQFYEGKEEHE